MGMSKTPEEEAEHIITLLKWNPSQEPLTEREKDIAYSVYLAGYHAGLAAEKWIDVKERLPREYEVVTVHQHGGTRGCAFFAYAEPGPFDKSSSPQITWYQGERTYSGCNEELLGMAVTHWQELPTAPKEEK